MYYNRINYCLIRINDIPWTQFLIERIHQQNYLNVTMTQKWTLSHTEEDKEIPWSATVLFIIYVVAFTILNCRVRRIPFLATFPCGKYWKTCIRHTIARVQGWARWKLPRPPAAGVPALLSIPLHLGAAYRPPAVPHRGPLRTLHAPRRRRIRVANAPTSPRINPNSK